MTRYELLERIGHGGMAEIFRGKAVAAGGFEKPVAIKRILPHLCQDERFVRLLIDEANLLSHLRHRNIVQIFDMGLGEDGQYFLVMELVDGTDLDALYDQLEAKRKRLPLDLALHIAAEVCEALHHAHLVRGPDGAPLGLVHRDVSPANILISVNGEVKLTDFGIAKQSDELTGHGSVRGKFAYISPEQAVNEHVDARSDVYSLGIVLYELLLGHRLFSALPDFDALKAVRLGDVTAPSKIDPEFDPKLEQIVMSALAKDPADRPESAGVLGSTLRGYRYSLPATGADPAKELSRILARADRSRADTAFPEHEPTVVRIQTSTGFTSTGFDFKPSRAGQPAFLADLEFDDDETTAARAMPAQLSALVGDSDASGAKSTDRNRRLATGASNLETVPNPVLDLSIDPSTDGATASGLRDTPLPSGEHPFMSDEAQTPAKQSADIVAVGRARSATPTARDQFLSNRTPDGGAPASSAAPSFTQGGALSQAPANRRNSLLLLVAVVVVAVGSFFVASSLLGKSEKAGTTATDAGMSDAAPAPDTAQPRVLKRPKRRRTRRKRSRRKSPKRTTPKKKSTKKSTNKPTTKSTK